MIAPMYVLMALAAVNCQLADGANILAVFPHTGKSHFFMFEPLMEELSNRGHAITLISHYKLKKPSPRVNFISLEGTADKLLFNSLDLNKAKFLKAKFSFDGLRALNRWGLQSCDTGLGHPRVRQLIRSKPSFDLVLVEFFNTDCFAILSRVFDAPLAGIFSSAPMPWHYDRFGNPDNPSYIVAHFNSYPSRMNLYQRVLNTAIVFTVKLYYKYYASRPADAIIRNHLGDGLPPVEEVVKNASLFLVNSHFTVFQAKPLVPGIIEIGGMHVSPGKKLPKHLEDFMNASKNGVVLFSLGSTIIGSSIAEEKRKAMASAFGKLQYDVIWKWESGSMPDKPANVLLEKWVPQNDILAHPKTKLFVTHSGLMGTEEAVYHGVPMVMIPMFGDQPQNAASCMEKGLGVVIDYESLTEETFLSALKSILGNKSYAERAKYVAETFRDRPLSITDTAIYWLEYVIKYKGAPHLRSAAVHLPWYSEYLLDVLAVICALTCGTLLAVYFALAKCIGLFRGMGGKSKQN